MILQGCGGDLADWVHGINKQLTVEGILKNGSEFTQYYSFEYDGMTNILFSMDGVDLEIGRLTAWRLQTHNVFGGTWLSDYLPNKFGVELGELASELPPETGTTEATKTTKPFALKAYIKHPNRSHDGSFFIPLPTKPEVIQAFFENLRIDDIHNVKISEIYSIHDDDNNLSHWLDVGLKATDNNHSLEELNYLITKIADMDEEQRDLFSAALQSGFCVDTIDNMINLTENLDHFELSPFYNAECYGEFLVMMHQDNLADSFKKLENSADEYDQELAKHIERLEKCVDNTAYGKLIAKEESGKFTDYGYLRRFEEFENFKKDYRGVQDIPLEHRLTKPTLAETLEANFQKSRETFGEPASPKTQDKGEAEI